MTITVGAVRVTDRISTARFIVREKEPRMLVLGIDRLERKEAWSLGQQTGTMKRKEKKKLREAVRGSTKSILGQHA